jgi:hypothetical protein
MAKLAISNANQEVDAQAGQCELEEYRNSAREMSAREMTQRMV